LFLEYGDEIRRIVWRHLGPAARREDVDDGLQYIFQQFVKNDAMAQYESGRISDYTGQPVRFKAFIMAKVPLYCRGLRETLTRRNGRELLVLDNAAGAHEEGGAQSTRVVDYLGTSDEYPSLAGSDAMDWLREELAARDPGPSGLPVLPLFDALAERSADGKSVSAAAVRRQFGMSAEEAEAWFAELKDTLREVTSHRPVEAPAPAPVVPDFVPMTACEPETAAWFEELRAMASGGVELGGLLLSLDEVRAAATALKNSRGNRVLPAFKDAGHRLAGAGKTWYLGFAEAVMQQYPHLRVPPRRHAEGHFGRVKQALIYGLERLVEDVPADAPVAEPVVEAVTETPSAALWAELESVITRLSGFDGDKVEAALEAVRLLAAA
jgi:hypothetical protein